MTQRTTAVLIAVTVLLFLCAALVYLWPYNLREFSGDGAITDTGFWSYPRYHVRFPPVSLTEPGTHTFTCQGLPPADLTFTLRIVGVGEYDVLTRLETKVRFELSDETGRLADAAGPLKSWTLAWDPADNTGYYWQASSRDIQVKRGRRYRLTVVVDGVDAGSPPLVVEPTLDGGGNELP